MAMQKNVVLAEVGSQRWTGENGFKSPSSCDTYRMKRLPWSYLDMLQQGADIHARPWSLIN
jgi:hypothetical protein